MYEHERRSRRYYNLAALWYDWGNRFTALLRGESATTERRKAIRRLNLQPGQRLLEVSVGTGTNLPLIAEQVGPNGRLVGVDISAAMLRRCRQKLRRQGLSADLTEGEAAHLPFTDQAFDAVLHHGGIAEFGDRRAAIEEMARVARHGAKVVICDLGVPSDRQLSLVNRLLLKAQPGYAKPPPTDLLPPAASDVNLSWFHGGAWYMIEFVIP